MRNLRMLVVVLLCLVLAAPALAVEREQERAGWGVVDWVSQVFEWVVGKAEGNLEPNGVGGGELEPNGSDNSESDAGGNLEPNG